MRDTGFVESPVEIEYYDGRNIGVMQCGIVFRKIPSEKVAYWYTTTRFQIGQLILDDNLFAVGLTNRNRIEFNDYNSLWIDTNGNRRWDAEDFWEQLCTPFTFLDKSYQLAHLDRFGEYIVIEACDAREVPPIAKGLPAPDFEATTLDSVRFRLFDMRGKIVLLDFWGPRCGPCIREFPHLKAIYGKLRDRGFEIVGIGLGDPNGLKRVIQKEGLDWIHIQDKYSLYSGLMHLYQVSALPAPFLINRDGVIVAIGEELRGDKLEESVERFIE